MNTLLHSLLKKAADTLNTIVEDSYTKRFEVWYLDYHCSYPAMRTGEESIAEVKAKLRKSKGTYVDLATYHEYEAYKAGCGRERE